MVSTFASIYFTYEEGIYSVCFSFANLLLLLYLGFKYEKYQFYYYGKEYFDVSNINDLLNIILQGLYFIFTESNLTKKKSNLTESQKNLEN